jgi:hypothetical protein
MKYIFTLSLLLAFGSVFSQDFVSSGARSQSLANSAGASIYFWNVTNNPSTTAFMNNASVGIDIRTNFMIKEISTSTIALIIPFRNYGNFGAYFQRFGYSTFNENKLAISFSRKLSNTTSASIQIRDNIQNINSTEFSSTENELGFNIGVFTKLNEKIQLASYYNFQKNITVNNVKNIQELSLALSWLPISDLNVLLEISKRTNSDFSIRGGIEYKILDIISARVGASSVPLNMSLGLGIMFHDLNVDVSFAKHQHLGTTSAISGNYIFGNN